MKVGEFRKIIQTFIELMEVGKAVDAGLAFFELFDGYDRMSVSDLAKKGRPDTTIGSSWTGATVSDLKNILIHFHALAKLCAKKAVIDDLKHLISFFDGYETAGVDSFLEAARTKLHNVPKKTKRRPTQLNEKRIVDFVSQLESSYREASTFYSLLEKLKVRSVSKAETVEIATRFVMPLAKSTTKKRALEHIEDVHIRYMGSGLKREATKGRSAA